MIGVEVPYPGMRYFHFTFCVSLHVRGGVASAAPLRPVAGGGSEERLGEEGSGTRDQWKGFHGNGGLA
jgi:hypothetical protein